MCGCVHGRVGVCLGSGAGRGSERTICGGTGLREWREVVMQCGGAGKVSSGGGVR